MNQEPPALTRDELIKRRLKYSRLLTNLIPLLVFVVFTPAFWVMGDFGLGSLFLGSLCALPFLAGYSICLAWRRKIPIVIFFLAGMGMSFLMAVVVGILFFAGCSWIVIQAAD